MKSLKAALAARRIQTVPPGWKKAQAFARANGYGTIGGQFSHDLNEAMKAGLVRKKNFLVMTSRGVYPTPHYLRVK